MTRSISSTFAPTATDGCTTTQQNLFDTGGSSTPGSQKTSRCSSPTQPPLSNDVQMAYARRTDPETSKQAAASLTSVGAQREKILQLVRSAGLRGMTAFELTAHISTAQNNIASRLNELHQQGVIVACGKRPGSSGRSLIVWCTATRSGTEPNHRMTGKERVERYYETKNQLTRKVSNG